MADADDWAIVLRSSRCARILSRMDAISRRLVKEIALLLDRLSEDDAVSCVEVDEPEKESAKDAMESSRTMSQLMARVRLLDFLDFFKFFALQDSSTSTGFFSFKEDRPQCDLDFLEDLCLTSCSFLMSSSIILPGTGEL